MRIKLGLMCLVLGLSKVLCAQEIATGFENEKAVISNYEEVLTISFNKMGKLEATTSVVQEATLQKSEGLGLLSDKDLYHSFFSELKNVNAFTIKPGKKGKKTPLLKKETKNDRSSSIFYEDGKITTLHYGSLEPGASTYLKYQLTHRDVNILPSKFLQYYMPIQNFVYRVITPANLDIRFAQNMYGSDWVKYSVEKKKNQTIHTFSGVDIPSFDRPDYSPPIKYCMPHIVPIIEEYVDAKKGNKIVVNKGVKDLYAYYQSYMGKANLETEPELKKTSMEIVEGLNTDREKAKAIFDWVKEKIKYVAFEDAYGGFVPRLAKDVCNKRYGDCKDMATLLVHLLRSQNLQAYHTWIGTRDIPYTYTQVPTTASDNHMICALYLDKEWIILDATNSFIPFGFVPDNIQGKEALIGISKDSFLVKPMPIAPPEQNVIVDTTWMEIDGDKVKGTIHLVMKGYKAFELKTYLSYKDTEDKEDYIKRYLYRGSNKCLLDKVKWKHTDEGTVDITASFSLDSYLQEVSGDIYLNTMLNKLYAGFRIKEEDRVSKVDNQWASKIQYVYYLKLPDGYKVAYKPENLNLKVPNHYDARVTFLEKEGQLVSDLSITYNALDILPGQLKDHNNLVSQLEARYKEVVHLKK